MHDPYQDEPTRDRLRHAALAALGVTGVTAGAQAIPQILRDRAENDSVRKTRGWDKLLKQLTPGDVIFSRRGRKNVGKAEVGPFEFPFTEQDVMNVGKGDPFYHAAVYEGGGNVLESADWEKGIKRSRLWKDTPEELRVYRAPEKDASRALKFMSEAQGTPYKSEMGVIKHGAKHLAGLSEKTTGNACKAGKNGLVCTEAVAEAFPGIFKNKLAGPAEMRAAEQLKLVARYGGLEPGMREILLSRLVHPVIKNAKWGALAGAGVMAANALMGDSNDEPKRA